MITMQIGPYRATLSHDKRRLVIHDVDIFVTCKRDGNDFNGAWLKRALDDAKDGEKRGYLPPIHVQHHGRGGEEQTRFVGVFRMKRLAKRFYRDQEREAMIADMVITEPQAIQDILEGRLPYRSIEIFDRRVAKIDSLAMLDHEPPYLELPMTVPADVLRDVEGSGIFQPWTSDRVHDSEPVVAFSRAGHRIRVLMEEAMDKPKYRPVAFQKPEKPEEEEAPKAADEAAEEAPEITPEATPAPVEDAAAAPTEADPMAAAEVIPTEAMPEEGAEAGTWLDEASGETPSPGGLNVEAIVAAIESGEISVKDFHVLHAAMEKMESVMGVQEESPAEEAAEAQPAMAEAAGAKPKAAAPAEAMKRAAPSDKEARLMAREDALRLENERLKRDAALRETVEGVLDRLSGRALGENPKERLTTFAREHGIKALEAYADELAKVLPPAESNRFVGAAERLDFGRRLPDEVLAFQRDGEEAVERAATLAKQYDVLKSKGLTRVPLDRFLSINMSAAGK